MTETPRIRIISEPEPELIAKVAALEYRAFGLGGLNEWHLPVIARHGWLFILETDGRIVGAASVLRDKDARSSYLFDFVIEPSLRGRGYGTSLIKRLIREMSENGIERVELTVAPENKAAAGLYEKQGFKQIRVWADEYGQGQDRCLMALELKSQERES